VPHNHPRPNGDPLDNDPPSLFAGIDAIDYPNDDDDDDDSGGPSNSSQLPPPQNHLAPVPAPAPPQDPFSVASIDADPYDPDAHQVLAGDLDSEGWREAHSIAQFQHNLDAFPNWRGLDLHRAWSHSSVDDIMRKSIIEPTKGKHANEKFDNVDSKEVAATLSSREAVAVIMYRNATAADPLANDVWPHLRDFNKLPSQYYRVGKGLKRQPAPTPRRRVAKLSKTRKSTDGPAAQLRNAPPGRPCWMLPVELVEMIARYLDRDDIKSLRLVSRELNQNVSQALFRTAVVPFNTEIYGMLGREPGMDVKGKKKAGTSNFIWKNANGDDVYNGHGMDVFRGFGAHIIRYGMSFEVSEISLAKPPVKTLTERHESFWGAFEWPFVEYRRFEDVAGLESAVCNARIRTTYLG
jgi:hypothetical protein